MHGSPEDLIKGTWYYVHFIVPDPDDPDKPPSRGKFHANYDGMDRGGGDDKQLYLYFKGGKYVDVRHVRYINVADEN